MLGDLGFDPVYAGWYVDAIHYRIIIGVLLDDIVIEKGVCLRGRRSRKAEHVCPGEVIQYSTPLAINGAMAFVDNDELEVIWRQLQIIAELDDLGILFFLVRRVLLILGVFIGVAGDGVTGQNSKQLL